MSPTKHYDGPLLPGDPRETSGAAKIGTGQCPTCTARIPPHATSCTVCGHSFGPPGAPERAEAASGPTVGEQLYGEAPSDVPASEAPPDAGPVYGGETLVIEYRDRGEGSYEVGVSDPRIGLTLGTVVRGTLAHAIDQAVRRYLDAQACPTCGQPWPEGRPRPE